MRMKILSVVVAMTAITVQADIPGENGPGSGGCPTASAAGKVGNEALDLFLEEVDELDANDQIEVLKKCFSSLVASLNLDQFIHYIEFVDRIDVELSETEIRVEYPMYDADESDDYFEYSPHTVEMMNEYVEKRLVNESWTKCLRSVSSLDEAMDHTDSLFVAGLLTKCKNPRSLSYTQISFSDFVFNIRKIQELPLPKEAIQLGITDDLVMNYASMLEGSRDMTLTEIETLEELMSNRHLEYLWGEEDIGGYTLICVLNQGYYREDETDEKSAWVNCSSPYDNFTQGKMDQSLHFQILRSRISRYSLIHVVVWNELPVKSVITQIKAFLVLTDELKKTANRISDRVVLAYLKAHFKEISQDEISELLKLLTNPEVQKKVRSSLVMQGIHCPVAE